MMVLIQPYEVKKREKSESVSHMQIYDFIISDCLSYVLKILV